MDTDKQYKAVYQTWSMIRPSLGKADPSEEMQPIAFVRSSESKTRHLIQKLRIEKRLTVAALADAVKCDVETLAAYERGDELLNTDMIKQLERYLSR